jgi:internalin A
LGRIEVSELFPGIGNLKSLIGLSLDHTYLSSFPTELLELTPLETLSVIDNDISSLPAEIRNLQNLKDLNLSGTPLAILPDEIGDLKRLESLWLANSALTSVPHSFRGLSKLKYLSLHSAKLNRWPEELFDLTNLEVLVLSNTGIDSIPSSISRLQNLTHLELESNHIKQIPEEMLSLHLLKTIEVEGNPITNPPPEIVALGTTAIQDYFSALGESGISRLFEAKLVIVGEGEVGKTCLAHKLVDPTYDIVAHKDDIATTPGIEIKSWAVETAISKNFRVNVWDFGGQEIYHATHQFFLTKRSLYLFVWDARKEDRIQGFDYWLNIVSLLSDRSPILIVLNKSDERIKEIDQASLKEKFDGILDFYRVSALTGKGLVELTSGIKDAIEKLPHIGDKWPAPWGRVRKVLEDDARDYIDYDEYLSICNDSGLA